MGDDLLHPGGAASFDKDEVTLSEVIAEKIGGGGVSFKVKIHLDPGGSFVDESGAGRHGDKGIDAVGDDTLTKAVVLGHFELTKFPHEA